MPPPSKEQLSALAERAVPLLNEFGLRGFVLVGYLESADGKKQRVCIANTDHDAALEDGLRPMIQFAHMWGASTQPPPMPPTEGIDHG
jgi:hypothetical protein